MAKGEIVLVLSILVSIASSGSAVDYDYFQIVRQWQPSTCSDANMRNPCWQDPAERFSIHGVWPSLYNGQFLQYCPGSAFDITKITTIRMGLDANWPNVNTGDNPWLWNHEWTKHGTCSEEFFNQLQYFTLGLNAYNDYNILAILQDSQIIPNGQVYTSNQVQAAITAATGSRPALRCNTNYWTRYVQLFEITMCYTRNAATTEDCPLNANNCPAQFVWYSWNAGNATSS